MNEKLEKVEEFRTWLRRAIIDSKRKRAAGSLYIESSENYIMAMEETFAMFSQFLPRSYKRRKKKK